MNAGFISASSCARSGRSPFDLFLKVFSGKSEITSNANFPVVVASITNDAVSKLALAKRVDVYFCQLFDEVVIELSASISPFVF